MPKNLDFSGLEGLTMDGLLNNGNGASATSGNQGQGKPLEISLEDIVEDPDQPRKIFGEDSLKELAESIKRQGLLMPISVRPRPDGQPGYMIIAGARRYRAFRLAGMTSIPAFVRDGNGDDRYAQMAENIHRDNLSHNEIAAFIAGELSQGKKQVQIAQALGKSKAYVSRYAALADSPDWIKSMVADGRCNDIKIISSLIKRAESDLELKNKLASVPEITKATLAALDASTGDQAFTPEPVGRSPETQAWSRADTPAFTESAELAQDQADFMPSSDDSDFVMQEPQGMEVEQNNTSGIDYKESTDTEPSKTIIVYVGGRKGFLKNKKLKVCFEDNGEQASVAVEDVSFS